jgi:hypothetical protein
MSKNAWQQIVLVDQVVCPKEAFAKLISDQFVDQSEIIDPAWWTSEALPYQEAVDWFLAANTVICYKLGITNYRDLVHISDQLEDYNAFEQERDRINLENWTTFTEEDLFGYENGNETAYLNWKEVDGIMYVLERLPGVTSIYKKA